MVQLLLLLVVLKCRMSCRRKVLVKPRRGCGHVLVLVTEIIVLWWTIGGRRREQRQYRQPRLYLACFNRQQTM